MNSVDTRMHGVPSGPAAVGVALPQSATVAVDLRGLGEVLRRRQVWIIATTVLFFSAAASLLLVMSPRYTATAQVLIDAFGLQILQNELTTKPVQSDSFLTDIESQVQVIGSDGVLTKVIQREHLDADPEFGATPPGIVAKIGSFLGVEQESPDAAKKALIILQKRVRAQRLDRTSVISLSVWSEDPQKAARIANAITSVYLDGQAEVKAEAARRASAALLARLDKLRERAEESEAAVEQYKARNAIIGASGELVNEQQLKEMNTELTAARRQTNEQRSRYNEIERLRREGIYPDSIAEVELSKSYAALRERYAAAKQAQAYAFTEFGPRHPSVRAVSAQVEQLRGLLDDEIRRIGRTALSDLNRAIANEQAAEQKLESLKRTALKTNDALVRLRELEREAESNRAVYSSLLVRSKELAEQRRVDNTNSRVITEATPPVRKSGPPSLLIIGGALAFGGIGGVGLALVREQFDRSIQSARQLSAEFGLRVLAALPALSAGPSAAPDEPAGTSVGPVVERDSPAAEQLRNLRDTLIDVDRTNAARVVMLMALDRNGSAAALGFNLAAITAADGDDVLLIDNCRQRVLTNADSPKSSSLTSVPNSGNRTLLDNVICSSNPNSEEYAVKVDTGGRGPRRRNHILRDLISRQRGLFDLIIFEWGAQGPSPMIRSFAELIDDVVIVVEAGRSRKEDLHRTIDLIRESGAPLRGVVLLGTDGRGAA